MENSVKCFFQWPTTMPLEIFRDRFFWIVIRKIIFNKFSRKHNHQSLFFINQKAKQNRIVEFIYFPLPTGKCIEPGLKVVVAANWSGGFAVVGVVITPGFKVVVPGFVGVAAAFTVSRTVGFFVVFYKIKLIYLHKKQNLRLLNYLLLDSRFWLWRFWSRLFCSRCHHSRQINSIVFIQSSWNCVICA